MKRWGMLGIAMLMLAACGREVIYVDKDGKPVTPEDCTPKPVTDSGSVYYIAKGPGAPIPDSVQIGIQLENGLESRFEPGDGLSNPNAAQPIASPDTTTTYVQTVRNPRCNLEAKGAITVIVLKEGKKDQGFVVIGGKKYPTGYNDFYRFLNEYRATYLHMGTGYYASTRFQPEEHNLRPPQFHVNSQPAGSCWSEGARSGGEATYYYVTKKWEWISTQRIIDCSGFGSAAGGGQIAVDDFINHGLVREADYPYNGHDNRCKKDVAAFTKAKRTFIVRDKNGNFPTWPDIKQAMLEFGAGEICGSAGSLGDGGWVANPGGGPTNHCYSAFGYAKGELHGQPAGEYLRVMNSWSSGWGISGEGYYRISKDGIKITSNVMTENKWIDLGSPCPPPKVDAGPDKTILQVPGMPEVVEVGVAPEIDQTYEWKIISGDTNPSIFKSSPLLSKALVKPSKTTRLQLNAKNACAEAHAEVTIHVWRKTFDGKTLEVN